ncbi:MAG: four-carbon acid sugar kinase family protein [Sneathiellales bacterium]|nr:four-carbon acid sugar kinase family protein [Sneathiellales bacterium]
MLLGCIADDLTGATDLAMILVAEGMQTVQIVGVPDHLTPVPDADAVIIALKSRTIPAKEAVSQSLECCRWLKKAGAKQIFFKYCSTFDSTSEGNIGPVSDALMKELDCSHTIACPAFPKNGRTVYQGNLFVFDQLLSESSMKTHPLTPMTDSNLARVLSAQSRSNVENIYCEEVSKGEQAIRTAFSSNSKENPTIYILDAIHDEHLKTIGQAISNLPLVTGGSAVAMGLPANFQNKGLLNREADTDAFRPPAGRNVILSGSCSDTTLKQIRHAKKYIPSFKIDPNDIARGAPVIRNALEFSLSQTDPDRPVLIYSSAGSEDVRRAQSGFGKIALGEKIEIAMGEIAKALSLEGFNRFVVAGGETSGAVIQALEISSLHIGPEIDPGVPWTLTTEEPSRALALKSGNFGSEDFFIKALELLEKQMKESAGDK